MKRFRHLEFLVFKLGGVAGAVRRIIYRWKGLFTASLIQTALVRKYPLLVPAPFQVQDTLEFMERCNRIQTVLCDSWERLYKLAPYQLKFRFA